MERRTRRWTPGHLLFAWCAYWLTLVLAALGRPALLAWGLQAPGRHGSVSASFSNDVLSLTVTENGATRWAGGAPFLVVALWLAVPPLLLFVAWWLARPARRAPQHAVSLGAAAPPGLGDGSGLGAGAVRGRSERVRPE